MSSSSLFRFAWSAAISLGLAGLMVLTLQAQQPRTVSQGVYSDDQAKRGEAVYAQLCASCHGPMMDGRRGPPLVGVDFLGVWGKQPLSELAAKIQRTMPREDSVKLTAQQSVDLVAYMLQVGKFPSGREELRADEAVLKQITWPAGSSVPAVAQATAPQDAAFPPAGNMAQLMRGIFFPNANIIFTVQTVDPAVPSKTSVADITAGGGFNWAIWGNSIYDGWDLVDYAATALADAAPLMLTPGRRCENGRPVPVNDPEWIKFTMEMAEAGRAAYRASQTRNQETVSDFTNQLNEACLHCHSMYRDRRGRPAAGDPTNRSGRCVK